MSENRPDVSTLTGSQLVRAFLAEFDKPRTTTAERAAFFDFKARVFAAIAERDDNPEAGRAASRARVARDRLLAEIDTVNGGEV
ncbi:MULTISPECIES: hypothetical protein [Nocardiopsis]|uniref:hypothetical protein n=1 Tax=Nocardiopsis TaxID=2013 RepID=UPI0026F44788|nr:hypothetical protein [Nocardiopsis sp. YSL2]MEE2043109.1 hypothetical protein [Nocardiopsis tropica]